MCTLGKWQDAEDMLTQMLDKSTAANVETYNMLIHMYCKEGMVAQARALFEYMIDEGQVPDIITYNALIDGYCLLAQMGYFQMGFLHSNDVSKSLEFVSIMTNEGFTADAQTTSLFVDLLIDPRVSKENKALL
ncbi:pentatricopeptide repeat-containing protein At1g62914, mitochondrial-like [Beta vulgaris subsp. vulgaris]|uniref:pentatricopeptide repeat-containing protein At1g62914, mitochondrial-like n=1 Tax=Beta vulgaris subsp. vulgaris TaxID=3555 RepID=UPI00053FB5EB|nr:pentatricopeptide repeat-containing protein At1g62914, mitochondrial-like [Beta vulgaris subsp. vulgaris]